MIALKYTSCSCVNQPFNFTPTWNNTDGWLPKGLTPGPGLLQRPQGSAMGSLIMTQTPQTNGIRQQLMHWLIDSTMIIPVGFDFGSCPVIEGDWLWVTTLVIWKCRWKCQRYLWGAMKYLDDQPNYLADLWSLCTVAVLCAAFANTFWFLAEICFQETTPFFFTRTPKSGWSRPSLEAGDAGGISGGSNPFSLP